MPQETIDVLCERIEGIKTFIEEKFRENDITHQQILTQTTKTNGSVVSIKKYQWMIIGGGMVVSAFALPILLWLIQMHLKD